MNFKVQLLAVAFSSSLLCIFSLSLSLSLTQFSLHHHHHHHHRDCWNNMRAIARQFGAYLSRRHPPNDCTRKFCSLSRRDELSMEEETERKVGWLLKLIYVGTASAVGYQFFPYMGDNLLLQSVSLLQVKDPLFKRMGAYRLYRFAVNDEKRMKIVEIGGERELLNMLGAAKDDRTRKSALRALAALANSDDAVGALYQAGAVSVIKSTPMSSEDAEIKGYKSNLVKRFQDLKYDEVSGDASDIQR